MPIPSEVSDYISSLPIKVSPAVGIARKLIEQKLMRSIGILKFQADEFAKYDFMVSYLSSSLLASLNLCWVFINLE